MHLETVLCLLLLVLYISSIFAHSFQLQHIACLEGMLTNPLFSLSLLLSTSENDNGGGANTDNDNVSPDTPEPDPVPGEGLEGSNGVQGDPTSTPAPEQQNNESPSTDNMKILGNISLDYSRINEGIIVVLVGGYPFLTINLHWILSHMSRNSRKVLGRWLQQKTLDSSPWPLQLPNSSSSNSSSAGSSSGQQQIHDSTAASEPTGSEKHSNDNQKNAVTISPAFHAFLIRLLKACGLSSLNHSNSIFDSLRIWTTKNNPQLYVSSANSKNQKMVTSIKLDTIVEKAVAELKTRRSTIRKGTGRSSNVKGS
jgi:hypothetical protein